MDKKEAKTVVVETTQATAVKPVRAIVEVISELEAVKVELAEDNKAAKETSAKKGKLELELMEALREEQGESYIHNDKVYQLATSKSARFDTTKFKNDHPELYKEYLKETEKEALKARKV